MEYKRINNTYVLRVEKGEEVLNTLEVFCKEVGIKAGILEGIGATDHVIVGLFNTKTKTYQKTTLTGPMEITSLIGNISTKEGKPYLHCHINVADATLKVFGGHLNECYISATCEITILTFEATIEREFDEEIGLNLYQF